LIEAFGVDFCLRFVDEDIYRVARDQHDENRRKYHLVYYTDVHYSSLRRIKDHKFDYVGTPPINYNVDDIRHEKLEVWKQRKREFLKRIIRNVFTSARSEKIFPNTVVLKVSIYCTISLLNVVQVYLLKIHCLLILL